MNKEPQEEKKCCKKCCDEELTGHNICAFKHCPCHSTPTYQDEKREKWEEEFDQKFIAYLTSNNHYYRNIENDRAVIFFEDVVKIKDFIHTLITSTRISERENTRKEVTRFYEMGYNEALGDAAEVARNHRLSDWSGEAEVEEEIEQIAKKITNLTIPALDSTE